MASNPETYSQNTRGEKKSVLDNRLTPGLDEPEGQSAATGDARSEEGSGSTSCN